MTAVSQDPLDKLIHQFSFWCAVNSSCKVKSKVHEEKQGGMNTSRAAPSNRRVLKGSLSVEEVQKAEGEVIGHVRKSVLPGIFKVLSTL